MPPDADEVIDPVDFPKHNRLVGVKVIAIGAGLVKVAVLVAVQALASVTVTL